MARQGGQSLFPQTFLLLGPLVPQLPSAQDPQIAVSGTLSRRPTTSQSLPVAGSLRLSDSALPPFFLPTSSGPVLWSVLWLLILHRRMWCTTPADRMLAGPSLSLLLLSPSGPSQPASPVRFPPIAAVQCMHSFFTRHAGLHLCHVSPRHTLWPLPFSGRLWSSVIRPVGLVYGEPSWDSGSSRGILKDTDDERQSQDRSSPAAAASATICLHRWDVGNQPLMAIWATLGQAGGGQSNLGRMNGGLGQSLLRGEVWWTRLQAGASWEAQ